MDKGDVVDTMEYYSDIKSKILLFATTWMDLEGIMLSEISQRKTNTLWYHLCMESKKTKQKNTLMDTENKQVVAREEEGEGSETGEGVIKR